MLTQILSKRMLHPVIYYLADSYYILLTQHQLLVRNVTILSSIKDKPQYLIIFGTGGGMNM